jgi:hypothetical protein
MNNPTPETNLALATSQAVRLQRTTQILIPLLLAAIVLPLIGGVYLELFERNGGAVGAINRIALAIPAVCAAVAVIALHGVLTEYAAGRILSAKASDGFRRAGYWVLAAFFVKMIGFPLLALLTPDAPIAWQFEPLDIALMAFASLVIMIGTVLEAAAKALKADNDQIV